MVLTANRADAQATSVIMTTVTTTFDATPVTSTPSGLPTLAYGNYALPLNTISTVVSSCIDDSSETNAWSCDVPPSSLQITVNQVTGTELNEMSMTMADTSPQSIHYGSQAPVVDNPQTLKLVTDVDNPSYGPAWFFQVPYDKLVILPETSLSLSSVSKRNPSYPSPDDFRRRSTAEPGDKPWFCYWNGTLLETFVYINQTSSLANQDQSSSSLLTSAGPTSTSPTSTDGRGSSASTTGGWNARRQQTSISAASPTPSSSMLSTYPNVVRIEERRIPNSPIWVAPYCVQMVVSSTGTVNRYINSTGMAQYFQLNETEPLASKKSRNLDDRTLDFEIYGRQTSSSSCACAWQDN